MPVPRDVELMVIETTVPLEEQRPVVRCDLDRNARPCNGLLVEVFVACASRPETLATGPSRLTRSVM